jgi:hypothetical protein
MPPTKCKIREFTSGCSNTSIFRKFKACKFLFNSQFPRNISIRIIFAIKRWYFKLEFMKSIIIVAYLSSSMAIPPVANMLYRTVSVLVTKFLISRILIPIVVDLFIIVVVIVGYALDAGRVLVSSGHRNASTEQQGCCRYEQRMPPLS